MLIVEQSAALEWATPDAEAAIERAARTCWRSEPKGRPMDFVRMLIHRGHESQLEHASASLRLVTDRGTTHCLVRHRLASYGQESTHFIDYSKERHGGSVTFVKPVMLRNRAYCSGQQIWENLCLDVETAYIALIKAGYEPQIAKSVLPNCTKTEIVMTTNLREWRHVMRLRGPGSHAQANMQALMALALPILRGVSPACFEEFSDGRA